MSKDSDSSYYPDNKDGSVSNGSHSVSITDPLEADPVSKTESIEAVYKFWA